jgi:amidase
MNEARPAGSNVPRRAFLRTGVAAAACVLVSDRVFWPRLPPIALPEHLAFATAREAAAAIRRREISSRELTSLMLERIEKYRTSINAVATVTPEAALARAREADAALARGVNWGPLHGIPVTVKDAFEIAGVRTTAGLPALRDHVPNADAAVVQRLRRSGAVLLGNTNVPAGLSDWQSYNELYGTTSNPYDRARTPGGSTGGGAAAIAAGLCYLTIGSDIAGSIRVPAHFCGVYGHKPTLGIVSERGHIPPLPGSPPGKSEQLAVYGPLARSADDLEIALRIIAGPEGDDAIAYTWHLPPARHRQLRAYRIGYVLDDPGCPVSSEVRTALERAVDTLRRMQVPMDEGWPQGIDPAKQFAAYRFLLARTTADNMRDDLADSLRAARTRNDDAAVQALAYTAPYKYHLEVDGERRRARAAWQSYFRTHDVFLMPTAFVAAFLHDHRPLVERKLITHEGERAYTDLRFWISFATLTGLPATTAPVGATAEGLPVGIQIMGPYLEDATPIDFAAKLSRIIGGYVPPKDLR